MAKLIVSSYTDGSALTAAAAASMIPTYAVITLPAGYFVLGRMLRITASGRISNVVTTPDRVNVPVWALGYCGSNVGDRTRLAVLTRWPIVL